MVKLDFQGRKPFSASGFGRLKLRTSKGGEMWISELRSQ